MTRSFKQQFRLRWARGLTLLELVVVLTILTVLGVGVIANTVNLTLETRSQVTRDAMASLEVGILGRRVNAWEDPINGVPGFISDVGRLPVVRFQTVDGVLNDENVVVDNAMVLTPAELWDITAGPAAGNAEPWDIDEAPGDPGFSFGSGWRGPYIDPPRGAFSFNAEPPGSGDPTRGQRALLDGTRRPLLIFDEQGDPAVAGDLFGGVLGSTSDTDPFQGHHLWSLGANPEKELVLRNDDGDPAIAIDRTRDDVQFSFAASDVVSFPDLDGDGDPDADMVVVRLYGPSPVDGNQALLDQWPAAGEAFDLVELGTLQAFSNVAVGRRYLRIYSVTGTTIAPQLTDELTGESPAVTLFGSPLTQPVAVGGLAPPPLRIPR